MTHKLLYLRRGRQMAYFIFFAVTLLLALFCGLISRVAAEEYWM